MLLTDCISTFTSPKGWFTSPNFPGRYGNNLNCNWLITTNISTAVVMLDIQKFIIDRNNDFVLVYDGPTTSSPLLAVATGLYYSGLVPIVSSSTEMLVVLNSDDRISFSGINATYSVLI